MRLDQLDESEKERIDKIFDQLREKDASGLDHLFRSERVHNESFDEKVVLPSFNLNKVLSNILFSQSLYVCICPECIRADNFSQFKELVSRGLIVPIFQAPYDLYPEELISFSWKYDHVSWQEYQAFRYINMPAGAAAHICSCCSKKMFDAMFESVNEKRNKQSYLNSIYAIEANAYPLLKFDRILIESAKSACSKNKLSQVKRLSALSWAVNEIKTSIAFNSPLTIDPADIEQIPSDLSAELDNAKHEVFRFRSEAANSLGFVFSPQIPIGTYAELAQQYRPAISSLVSDIVGDTNPLNVSALSKNLMGLNSEIIKIKNSKRYAFYKASISFMNRNSNLINAAAIGTLLSPISSWLGCTAAVGSIVRNHYKKPTENHDTSRLSKAIIRDTQPYVDKLLELYFQSKSPAVRIMSIQEKLSEAEKSRAA